jgi:hypothetical protein
VIVYRNSPGVWVVSVGRVSRRFPTWHQAMRAADEATAWSGRGGSPDDQAPAERDTDYWRDMIR